MTNAATERLEVVGDVGDQGKYAGVPALDFAAWRRKRDQTDSVKSGPDTSLRRTRANQNQQPWETRPPHQQHPPAVGNAKSPTRSGSNLERRSAVPAQ